MQDIPYHPTIGSFMWDMTNELEDYGDGAVIDEFVSGGPKNVSLFFSKRYS